MELAVALGQAFGAEGGKWWAVRARHTRFQWAVQRALYAVRPFGESRADQRGALHTANLMRMLGTEDVSDDEFAKAVEALADYLPGPEEIEERADRKALRRMKEKQGAQDHV